MSAAPQQPGVQPPMSAAAQAAPLSVDHAASGVPKVAASVSAVAQPPGAQAGVVPAADGAVSAEGPEGPSDAGAAPPRMTAAAGLVDSPAQQKSVPKQASQAAGAVPTRIHVACGELRGLLDFTNITKPSVTYEGRHPLPSSSGPRTSSISSASLLSVSWPSC